MVIIIRPPPSTLKLLGPEPGHPGPPTAHPGGSSGRGELPEAVRQQGRPAQPDAAAHLADRAQVTLRCGQLPIHQPTNQGKAPSQWPCFLIRYSLALRLSDESNSPATWKRAQSSAQDKIIKMKTQ